MVSNLKGNINNVLINGINKATILLKASVKKYKKVVLSLLVIALINCLRVFID